MKFRKKLLSHKTRCNLLIYSVERWNVLYAMCEGRFHKLYLDVQSGMSYLLLWPLPLRKDLGVFKKVQGLFLNLLVLFTKLLVLFKGLYTDLLNWVCLSVSPIIFPTFFEYREFVLFLFLEMTIGTLSHSDICWNEHSRTKLNLLKYEWKRIWFVYCFYPFS